MLIPTFSVDFDKDINLQRLKQLNILGQIIIDSANLPTKSHLITIEQLSYELDIMLKGYKINSVDDISLLLDILNVGCPYVVVNSSQSTGFKQIIQELPEEALKRIIFEIETLDALETWMFNCLAGVIVHSSIFSWPTNLVVPSTFIIIGFQFPHNMSDDEKISFVRASHHKIRNSYDKPIHIATSDDVDSESFLNFAAECFWSVLKSDREDNLIPTIVADQYDATMGLVYSSKESIQNSLKSGNATYFSRSRNELWEKGKTSGYLQYLQKISFDCDADALKFNVVQIAPPGCIGEESFCHQNQYSCFRNHGNLGQAYKFDNLGGLFRTLLQRKRTLSHTNFENFEKNSDAEKVKVSYTQRLLSNFDMLEKKLLEESQELVEAVQLFKQGIKDLNINEDAFSLENKIRLNAKNNTLGVKAYNDLLEKNREVNKESADLLYLLVTACVAGEGDMSRVIREIEKRHFKVKRRPGNTKQHQINSALRKLK